MSENNITKYVGNRIKYFRENKNITQQELAEAMNTSQQSIARYESGERKADQNILFQLATYFNISINDFFPEIKNKASENDIKLVKEKIGNSNEFSEKDKETLIGMIDFFHSRAINGKKGGE